MGILLIIVGVLLIGLYIFMQRESANPTAVSKYVYGGIGVGAVITAVYLFANVGYMRGWDIVAYLVFSIAATVAAVKSFKAMYEAAQREAQDMEAHAKAKASHLQYEQTAEEFKFNRERAAERRRLEEEKARTEELLLQISRTEALTAHDIKEKEAETRRSFIDSAEPFGLTADQFTALNEYGHRTALDIKAEETRKKLERAHESGTAHDVLDAADRANHTKTIPELQRDLERLLEKRREIEKTEKDRKLRKEKVALYTEWITALKQTINEQQNRLLSSGNRKEIGGI